MRNLALIILTGLVIGAVAVTIYFVVRGDSGTDSDNLIFLLDRSDTMRKPLDGSTKLGVAIGAIEDILDQRGADLGNLALRQYGGACEGDNSQITLPFGQGGKDAVQARLGGISTDGETTLVGGVTEIPGDFKDIEIPEGALNHLIIISGSGDACQADLAAALTELRSDGIVVDLIGLDIPLDSRDALLRAANAAGAGIYFASSRRELASVLARAISRIGANGGGGFFQATSNSATDSENLIILLDRSRSMRSSLDGDTKLDLAVGVIDEILEEGEADLQNLAFRQYGGPCEGNNSSVAVAFGQGDTASIQSALQGLTIDGETTLVGGIAEIAADFSGLANTDDAQNHVIIITGSSDTCGANLAEALTLLIDAAISVDLIGLDIPLNERDVLRSAGNTSGARVFFVDSKRGLASILTTGSTQTGGSEGAAGGFGYGAQ